MRRALRAHILSAGASCAPRRAHGSIRLSRPPFQGGASPSAIFVFFGAPPLDFREAPPARPPSPYQGRGPLGSRAHRPHFDIRHSASQGVSGRVRSDSARTLISRPLPLMRQSSRPKKPTKRIRSRHPVRIAFLWPFPVLQNELTGAPPFTPPSAGRRLPQGVSIFYWCVLSGFREPPPARPPPSIREGALSTM